MSEADFWLRFARRLRRRLNFGTWAASVVPAWTAASLAYAAALLFDRGRGGSAEPWLALFFTVLLLATGLFSFVRMRRERFRDRDALVIVEDKLGLKNRLSAAAVGVGAWPTVPESPPALVRFRPSRTLVPCSFAIALVALAAWIPVAREDGTRSASISEPLAWKEMERALDVLREEAVVGEDAIEGFEERLEALRQKPREEWFRHGSLEASDSLREELRAEMRRLVKGLDELTGSLDEMAALGENAPAEARRLREKKLDAAIDDLELLTLPLSRSTARELHVLARERNVRKMAKEEIEKWREIRERLYHGLPGGGDTVVAGIPGSASGSSQPGRGGVSRGPATAPINLSDERTELGTTRIESVRGEDVSRGLFGDTVGISLGEHEVDTGGFRVSEAGEVASTGKGGDVVWVQSLTPRERRVLQKYFR
jgi:hypothetical protein